MGVAGLVLAILAMHNFVHMAPSYFSMIFSSDWVSEMRAHTVPNSLEFRGAALVTFG